VFGIIFAGEVLRRLVAPQHRSFKKQTTCTYKTSLRYLVSKQEDMDDYNKNVCRTLNKCEL